MERPHMHLAMRGVRSAVVIESILTPINTHVHAVEFPSDESHAAMEEKFLPKFDRNKARHHPSFQKL